jgi:hypothetical protein
MGRRTKYGQPLSERVPVYFTENQLAALGALVGGEDLGSFLRELALERLQNAPPPAPPSNAKGTEVRFLLSESEYSAFYKMAVGMGLGDANFLARQLSVLLSGLPLEEAKRVLLGEARCDAKSAALKNNQTDTSKLAA